MPYFQRFFVSVLVVFVLLFSLCAVPAKVAARQRCPVRIPDSLLTLYLKSDAVVVATIESERFVKTIAEYDYGTTFEVEKRLLISETLKGRQTDSTSFRDLAYKSKNPEEKAENLPNIGNKFLVFLTKNMEDNAYWLADSESGMKRLDNVEMGVYVKRIAELNQITASRKNQLGKLTEWLVRLAEEPVTREEGVRDLQDSFRASEYEREEEKVEAATKKRIVLDEEFRAGNVPEIAETLTESQKQRLTSALLLTVNEDVFKLNDARSADEITPAYSFISLAGNWDKSFLAMTAFALLQNAGDANRFKTIYLLDTITHLLENDELYEISSEYKSALDEVEAAPTKLPDEEFPESESVSPEAETPIEVEKQADNETVEQVVVEITNDAETPNTDEISIEKPAVSEVGKDLRQKLFERFVRQYGAAISQLSASK